LGFSNDFVKLIGILFSVFDPISHSLWTRRWQHELRCLFWRTSNWTFEA